MKKALIYSLLIVVTCAVIMRLIINHALATETTVISQPWSDSSTSGQTELQGFTLDTETNVSGVVFYSPGAPVTMNAAICLGSPANDNASSTGIWANSLPVCGTTNLKIASVECTTTGATTTCPFSWTYTLNAGNYYLKLYTAADMTVFSFWYASINKYSGGNHYWWDNGYLEDKNPWDLRFQIINDDTLEQWDPAWDYTLDQYEPDFNTVANLTCIIGEECRLWFSFNALALGYPIYLFRTDVDTVSPGNERASTTIAESPVWQNYVVVPNETASGTYPYMLLLDASSYGWTTRSLDIFWISQADWDELMDDRFAALADPCSDVASSTGSFGDDMRYGVECGARKVIAWIFYPNQETLDNMSFTLKEFQNNFPMSSWNAIKDEIDNASTTATRGDGLSIPFGLWQTKEMVEPEPIAYMTLSTTTIMEHVDEDTFDNFYDFMVVLIYLGGFSYVLWRLFTLNKVTE